MRLRAEPLHGGADRSPLFRMPDDRDYEMRDRVCAGEKGDMAAEYCGGVVLGKQGFVLCERKRKRKNGRGGELEKLRIIFTILTLSAVLSGCSQNVIVSDSMDSWSDSSIVSKTAEEGEIVLEKGGYLWNQAEKSIFGH